MSTYKSQMSSSVLGQDRPASSNNLELSDNTPARLDTPIEAMPFRDAVRYGFGAYWIDRRYCKEVVKARMEARFEVEKNRLGVAVIGAKAVDQVRVTDFINHLWLHLEGALGRSINATEDEMRCHIKTLVADSFAAIKSHNAASDGGELPPAWRDRLVAREERRTDQLIDKLDRVLDELIEQRIKLMMNGISLPGFIRGTA